MASVESNESIELFSVMTCKSGAHTAANQKHTIFIYTRIYIIIFFNKGIYFIEVSSSAN